MDVEALPPDQDCLTLKRVMAAPWARAFAEVICALRVTLASVCESGFSFRLVTCRDLVVSPHLCQSDHLFAAVSCLLLPSQHIC